MLLARYWAAEPLCCEVSEEEWASVATFLGSYSNKLSVLTPCGAILTL